MNKCIFLDRDGVLNKDNPNYVYKKEDLIILEGVKEALKSFKDAGFKMVVITNQAGIAKGLYTAKEVLNIYENIQNATGNLLDALYFSPYHPKHDSSSLTRKPNSLMLEKAIARFDINIQQSWLIGDSRTDILAGKKLGIKSIQVSDKEEHCEEADFSLTNLFEASHLILKSLT